MINPWVAGWPALEQAHWVLHPRHLFHACYQPTLVTLAEVGWLSASNPAQDADGQQLLRAVITVRCQELNRRFRPTGTGLAVQPLTETDEALAAVTVLTLNLSGRAARVRRADQDADRHGRHITASDLLCPLPNRMGLGHVSALEHERFWSLDRIPQCIPTQPANSN